VERTTIVLRLAECGAAVTIECVWVAYGLFWIWYGNIRKWMFRLAGLKAFQEALSELCALHEFGIDIKSPREG